MRKLLLFCLLIPVFGMAQVKNVTNARRVFPKADKVLLFEKALINHVKKFHTNDHKWRVFKIQTGPDAGGYHIVEGPYTWEEVDSRGNLGAEHNNDWNNSVAIYLTDKTTNSYSNFMDSLSTVGLTDYAEKISINHVYPKLGWSNKVREWIGLMKPVWKAGGESVAVYQANASGPAKYTIVTRYKNGLKEKDMGYRKPFVERYEAIHGAGSYEKFLDMVRTYVSESWTELLFLRTDLSTN